MFKRANHWFGGLLFAALVAAQASGCAAPQADRDSTEAARVSAQSSSADGQVCRHERPTGSNIARRVCRDSVEADHRRERDQQTLRDNKRWGCQGEGCVFD